MFLPSCRERELAEMMLEINWEGIQKEISRRQHMDDIKSQGTTASTEDRKQYNLQVRLPHPDFPRVRAALKEVTEQNRCGPVRRKILGIGGNFLSGKSTMAEDLCVELCEAAWEQNGTEVTDDYARHRVQPVFFANASGSGEGDLMRSIVEGLGLPEPPQRSSAQLMLLRGIEQAKRSMTTHGWIDDVNALSSSSRRTYLAQFGKKLISDFPVTFVMIGKGPRKDYGDNERLLRHVELRSGSSIAPPDRLLDALQRMSRPREAAGEVTDGDSPVVVGTPRD
jgi:hypothetical protein